MQTVRIAAEKLGAHARMGKKMSAAQFRAALAQTLLASAFQDYLRAMNTSKVACGTYLRSAKKC